MRTSLLAVLVVAACGRGDRGAPADTTAATTTSPAASGVSLKLPPGFKATVFAENLGGARHVAVAPNGNVYVNTWRSPYDTTRRVPEGGYVVARTPTAMERPI